MIDVNAYLGHFAFRQLRHNRADQLLRLMDSRNIEQAVVSSAAAITYRNAQAGNEELASDVQRHRDRFIPFGVVNPAYAGWRDDLKICHEEFGAKGLRLYPRWHNYDLSDPDCIELVNAASDRSLVISIPLRVEDRRQQSWLVDIPDVDKEEIAALMKSCPDSRFILVNGSGYVRSPLGQTNNGLPANYVIDISLLTVELENEVGQLIENLGPERVVFGSGMPFHYPDPAIVKMEILDVSEAVKEGIRRRNVARLLRLPAASAKRPYLGLAE
ncbi:MAG: amidohydrolase family protein [Luteitalea sp.]|nr:amidohydrolase family protein [Luteitalea sp.]